MWVIWVDIAAAVIGVCVISLVAFKLYRRVKQVGRTISEASATIGELTATLERISPPSRGSR